MTLRRGETTPNTESLARLESVLEAVSGDWTAGTELAGGVSRFAPDYRVWDIFREENLWEPFARYFPDTLNGHEKFAVWVSLVEHKVNYRR